MKKTMLLVTIFGLFSTLSSAHTNVEAKMDGNSEVQIKTTQDLKSTIKSTEIKSSISIKHSGGTDSYGCHVNSSTGIRHCH